MIKLFDDNFNRLATWFVGRPHLRYFSIAWKSCFDRKSRGGCLDLTWTIKLFDDNFNRLAIWFVGHPLLGYLSIAWKFCFDRKLRGG